MYIFTQLTKTVLLSVLLGICNKNIPMEDHLKNGKRIIKISSIDEECIFYNIFKQNCMKANYQSPVTTRIAVETSILCASGPQFIAPKGNLESIGKGSGSW